MVKFSGEVAGDKSNGSYHRADECRHSVSNFVDDQRKQGSCNIRNNTLWNITLLQNLLYF